MTTQVDARELLDLLESANIQVVEQVKELILENLSTSKEAWLLGCLIDYYLQSQSKQCLEVLGAITEPNDKHLFEKLNEQMKHGQCRAQAMELLGQLVVRKPPWLHKIVTQPLMSTLIKCLKVDTDVTVLMSGVLIITALLPILPATIGSFLNEIFNIFVRLAAFNKRKPGNPADVHVLHLQVGIYGLFHRLYGMFPCNFLSFLRNHYHRKENRDVFEEVVKPMLERVRMHPSLVTASKESEMVTARWRKKETHDILVECSRVSLDVLEGTSEEIRCPVVMAQRMAAHPIAMEPFQAYLTSAATMATTVMATPPKQGEPRPVLPPGNQPQNEEGSVLFKYLMTSQDSLWSPSAVCGLSTPPPVTMSMSNSDLLLTPNTLHQGPPVLLSQDPTPQDTPRGSPPKDDEFWDKTSQPTTPSAGSRTSRPDLKSRHPSGAAQYTLTLTDTPPVDIPHASVPVSPLKKDFTTEPPLHAKKTVPVKTSAMRQLDLSDPDEETGAGAAATATSTETVSIQSLPHVIQSLSHSLVDPDMDRAEDAEDQEVCEITQGKSDESIDYSDAPELPLDSATGSSTSLPAHITAASVAQFMKRMNRIRFNSMNVEGAQAQTLANRANNVRSSSCPDLTKDEGENDLPENGVSDVQKSRSTTTAATTAAPDTATPQSQPQPVGGTTSISQQTTVTQLTAMVTSVLTTTTSATAPVAPPTEQERTVYAPYESLLSHILPHATMSSATATVMSSTAGSDGRAMSCPPAGLLPPMVQPTLVSSFSPPELLDRHIQLGGEVHAKQLSQIPLTSQQQTINWTHFGGAPPADEVNILRGQILLLHNQLLFERHKRELHAQRNRRLLGKIVKTVALEEHTAAMKDQLQLQEREIQNLQVALRLQQGENNRLRDDMDTKQYEKDVQLKKYVEQTEYLLDENRHLEQQLESERKHSEDLQQDLRVVRAELFSKNHELEALQTQAAQTQDLRNQINNLNKEVCLMGELQMKYQERLSCITKGHNPQPEIQILLQTYKAENYSLRSKLDEKTAVLDSASLLVADLEDMVKKKELVISELKHVLEHVRSSNTAQIQALTDKYASQRKVQLSLESHILQLHSDIEKLKKPAAIRNREKQLAEENTASDEVDGSNDRSAEQSLDASYSDFVASRPMDGSHMISPESLQRATGMLSPEGYETPLGSAFQPYSPSTSPGPQERGLSPTEGATYPTTE